MKTSSESARSLSHSTVVITTNWDVKKLKGYSRNLVLLTRVVRKVSKLTKIKDIFSEFFFNIISL